VEVCRFARAYHCRLLAEESAFGYDEMAKQTFYSLRAHLRVSWPEVISAVSLTPANVHDLLRREIMPAERSPSEDPSVRVRAYTYHGGPSTRAQKG
jgi:hypothetical protein